MVIYSVDSMTKILHNNNKKGSAMKQPTSNTELLHNKLLQLMVLTMEESGELVQACSKVLRKNNPNIDLIKEEIGDVYCMIQLCMEHGIVSKKFLKQRVKTKKEKLKKWSNLIG